MAAFIVLSVPCILLAKQPVTAAKSPAKTASSQVNINKADAAKLDTLPGIGPKIAGRIVKYRKEHGLFKTTQDLRKVEGIGVKKYAKLSGLITVK